MKNNEFIQDERQKSIGQKSLSIAGIFLLLCVIAGMFYKLFTTDELGWEFWAMSGYCLTLVVSKQILGDVERPRGLNNKPLPTGNTREEKLIRKKEYALQSAIFALACAVMDVILVGFGREDVSEFEIARMIFPNLNVYLTTAITAVIAFIVTFLISYIVDYLIGEKYKIKKYNQMIASLDEE